ncbi:hypothetical protein P3W45_000888 [Vairimorpha bombi]|jgi:hypothetical protein
MIQLTKSEINALILNYLTNESFIYTAYVFKNESKDDIKNIRKDVTLDKILSYGIQYMYGVEHYKDGKINICNGMYSLDRLHLCDVVVKKKRRKIKKEENEEKEISTKVLKKEEIDKVAENEEIDKVAENEEINKVAENEEINKVAENEEINKVAENEDIHKKDSLNIIVPSSLISSFPIIPLPTDMSSKSVALASSSLSPCKPCDIVHFSDEYLFLYTPSYLYTFKYGTFTGMKNINLSGMLYKDDILVMYDTTKITYHNTFNLKSRSVLHKCIRILYDGTKFVCINYDNTVSYYTKDGIKVLDNLFVFSDVSDGCILGIISDGCILCVWSNTGKVSMINTKTQGMKFYNGRNKGICGYCVRDSVLYLVYEDGIIGIYDYNEEIFIESNTGDENNRDTVKKYDILKLANNIVKYSDKFITIYEKEEVWKISKIYQSVKKIKKILNINDYILIVYTDTLCFYDSSLYLIKEYSVEDNIKEVALNGNEICILLEKESPLLVNIQ